MSIVHSTLLPAVRSALGSLRRSPLRSLILIQGVLWATVMGVLPPAIIRGSREAAMEKASAFGADRVLVYEAPRENPALDWSTVSALRDLGWPEIRSISAFGRAPGLLVVDGEHADRASRQLVEGRWLSAQELASGALVGLVSADAARARFGSQSAVGRRIPSPARPGAELTIVGTFEIHDERAEMLDDFGYRKEHPLSGVISEMLRYFGVRPRDLDWLRAADRVVVPAKSHPQIAVDVLELSVRPDALAPTISALKTELVRRGVRPIVLSNLIVQILFSDSFETLTRIHLVIFIVGVFAGVVVVVNTNILAVLERKREIAIRRVEGATRRVIAMQFVVETGTTCLAGSILGIPLALSLAWLRTRLDPSGSLNWIVPFSEVFQTVAAITVFGIVGGLLPAMKAARVEPAEVLSHE